MMACDFVCQNVKPFFSCLGQMIPIDGVLSVIQLSLVVYLSWFRHVTLEFSSVSVIQGSKGVKNTVCRPSRLSFHPAVSTDSKIAFKLNEHPRWNENCFQSKSIPTWPMNSGSIEFHPVLSWIGRIFNNVLQEFWQYWHRVWLLPFQITQTSASDS